MAAESPASVLVRGSDGVEVAIKSASTAPVAADPSLVVAVSPNTPALRIIQKVTPSTSNNSTTPLPAVGVFTGTGESSLDVGAIQVNVFSDASGVCSVQQSIDNVNWDIVDNITVLAGVGRGLTVQATASYFRIVYTNGSVVQTVFRLQVDLCPIAEPLPRSLGQKQGYESLAVVLASDVPPPLPSGAASEATLLDHLIRSTRVQEEMLAELGKMRLLLEHLADEKFGMEDVET